MARTIFDQDAIAANIGRGADLVFVPADVENGIAVYNDGNMGMNIYNPGTEVVVMTILVPSKVDGDLTVASRTEEIAPTVPGGPLKLYYAGVYEPRIYNDPANSMVSFDFSGPCFVAPFNPH